MINNKVNNFFYFEMMYPILGIYDLPFKKKQILKSILEINKFEIFDDFSLFYLNSKYIKKAFLNLDWNQLQTLNVLEYPVIMITDKKNYTRDFMNLCLKENLIPICFLGNPSHWNLPIFSIRKKKNLVIFFHLLKFKKIYKKIFEINGYHTITFDSINSIILFLEKEHHAWEDIFLIFDLDIHQNFMNLFIETHKLIKMNFVLLKTLHLIALKDLKEEILYPSLLNLKQFVKQNLYEFPPLRKIFDYNHFIFLLLESLFLSYKKSNYFLFYTLKDSLYNKEMQENYLEKKLYKLYLKDAMVNWIQIKKFLPFLWLYNTSLYKEKEEDLILS